MQVGLYVLRQRVDTRAPAAAASARPVKIEDTAQQPRAVGLPATPLSISQRRLHRRVLPAPPLLTLALVSQTERPRLDRQAHAEEQQATDRRFSAVTESMGAAPWLADDTVADVAVAHVAGTHTEGRFEAWGLWDRSQT
jgi:hypothetical protein